MREKHLLGGHFLTPNCVFWPIVREIISVGLACAGTQEKKEGRKKSHKKCLFHVCVEWPLAGGFQPNLINVFVSRVTVFRSLRTRNSWNRLSTELRTASSETRNSVFDCGHAHLFFWINLRPLRKWDYAQCISYFVYSRTTVYISYRYVKYYMLVLPPPRGRKTCISNSHNDLFCRLSDVMSMSTSVESLNLELADFDDGPSVQQTEQEPEAWSVTVDLKTLKKMTAKNIKRQDHIWGNHSLLDLFWSLDIYIYVNCMYTN